jgi:hypothetical protein
VSPEVRDRVAYGLLSMAMHNVFTNDIELSDVRTAAAWSYAAWLLGTLRAERSD